VTTQFSWMLGNGTVGAAGGVNRSDRCGREFPVASRRSFGAHFVGWFARGVLGFVRPAATGRSALALACLVGVASCSSKAPSNGDSSGDWGAAPAEIYLSALDTVLAGRFSSDSAWYVADTIYWWPLSGPRPHLALEGTSHLLGVIGREQGRRIVIVPLRDAIGEDGTRRVPGPLVILGPIDMLSWDGAEFRVNLYLGVHGQELYRLRCQRVGTNWRVVNMLTELST